MRGSWEAHLTRNTWTILFAAWTLAGISTFGALFVGEVMGQMPCVLCWYQRIAMFPLALILGVAAFRNDAGIWRYALPVALAGLAVAGYHSLMYAGVLTAPIEPCRAGPSCSGDGMVVLGVPLPFMATASFAAISTLLAILARNPK